MKRLVCVLFASLFASALLLASCGQSTTTTATSTPQQTSSAAPTKTTTSSPAAQTTEKPRYGGTYTTFIVNDPPGFDPQVTNELLCNTLWLANDRLLIGDWAKGPAGTGQIDWLMGNAGRLDVMTGGLATSWEMPTNDTIVFHIRPGVHWGLDPNNEASRLVNGREFTADDAAWNVKGQWAFKGGFLAGTNAPTDALIDAKALDKYTLQLTVPPAVQGLHLFLDGERVEMLAPDITTKYGNQSNWRNFATVGPFMLTDYVTGSAITFKKNPNYYMTDPVGPGKGQQLPYVDGVKMLIIPDLSTQQSAFRTGKLDQMLVVSWEDWTNFMKTNLQTRYKQDYGIVSLPAGREDKNLPFNDLRVRQALNYAVDKKAIVDGYYQGHAEILGWPFYKNASVHAPFYTPLDQMPKSVQDLFTYNPAKAKQLLADAGYPNGFQTNIVCSSSGTAVDVLSIVREQLLKVGVDMTIKPLEQGVFNSMNRGRGQDQMLFKETKMYFVPWKMHEVRRESLDNLSFWDSDQTRAVYNTVNANLFKDDAKWEKALKDVVPYILEQSPYIWMPAPYAYDIWQPWIKNYYGAHDIGYFCPERFARFIWVDADLKKSMGY